ncbi:MAG: aminotransferase class V-fold PLP-dependent enzyme [Tepidisphaeraceae bacterium]
MRPGRLYFDNSATSYPKPPAVIEAMVRYATEIGASAGRGAYAEAMASRKVLQDCREAVRKLINGAKPEHVIFTLNCSDALNLGIKGMIDLRKATAGEKQHVVCTDTDHNSTLRPLTAMRELGWVDVTHVPIDPATGLVDPGDIRKALRSNTRLLCVTHASNVTGALQPIREMGAIARERAVPYLVDAAQSIGHVDIDVEKDHIDLLAAPGHKGMLGAPGTGFLYIRPGLEKMLHTVREGGTGSQSDEDRHPTTMPEKYEAGSHNAVGLAGLLAGVTWLLERGVAWIREHELSLIRTFIEGVSGIEGLTYFGPQGVKDRVGVFSVRVDGFSPGELAKRLEDEFGILTRPGIHCAPHVHATLGTTLAGGTTRFSFGPFLTVHDVKYATDALATIAGASSANRSTEATESQRAASRNE